MTRGITTHDQNKCLCCIFVYSILHTSKWIYITLNNCEAQFCNFCIPHIMGVFNISFVEISSVFFINCFEKRGNFKFILAVVA